MFQDVQLEFNQQWAAYSNPGIGNPPTSMSVTPANAENQNLVVSINGPGYTNMMAATHRPLMPVFDLAQVYYSYEFNLLTDPNVTKLQVHENEATFCYIDSKGVCYYFNNSLQLNQVNPKGMIQAYTPANVWADTGIVIPTLAPKETYPIKISYMVDLVNHTMSTLSIVINGKVNALPAMFQKIPGMIKNPTWAPGVYCQFQLGLAKAGGEVTTQYNNVKVNWE